jgi:hypothetical protein
MNSPVYTDPLQDSAWLAWEEHLDENSDDFELRGTAMADFLEEHGDNIGAACLRWQAQARKRPWCRQWYDETSVDPDIDPGSDLPSDLFKMLPLSGGGLCKARSLDRATYIEYDSRRAAEAALRVAWQRLTVLSDQLDN